MASPKPPRSPLNPSRQRATFRRIESSPEMQGFINQHRRLPPLPDNSPSPSPRRDSPSSRDLPTLQEIQASSDMCSEQHDAVQETALVRNSPLHQITPVNRERAAHFSNFASPRRSIPVNLPPLSFRSFPRTISSASPLLEAPGAEALQESRAKPQEGNAEGDNGVSVDFRRGVRRQGKGKGLGGASVNEWVAPLIVFSLVCLGTMITTLGYCLNIVENYKDDNIGLFFHISDIHLDPLYRPLATPATNCRGKGSGDSQPYGQYGCDSPMLLLQSALNEMAHVAQKPDFILITGDMASFNLSDSNDTLHVLMQVDLEIQTAFPDPVTKILYTIGESELPPQWRAQPLANSIWLSRLGAAWRDSLEEAGPDAMETFKKGGYYTSVIEAKGKHRTQREPTNMAVIVLNTLFYSIDVPDANPADPDPAGQLAWLETELKQARHWGRKVLIAGHKPPGVKGMGRGPLWRSHFEERYSRIILEHADVVVGQLFGYLHRDQFRLMHPNSFSPSSSHETNLTSSSASKEDQGLIPEPLAHSLLGIAPALAGSSESAEGESVTNLRGAIPGGNLRLGRRPQEGSHREGGTPLRRFLRQYFPPRYHGWPSLRHALLSGWSTGPKERQAPETVPEGGAQAWEAAAVAKGRVRERMSLERRRREESKEVNGLEAGSGRGSALLMVPSLSPMFDNRPAFRLFRYDRWKLLLDYTEHTADLREPEAERMWGLQYGANSMYGIPALDTESLKDLSLSFFNESGMPTKKFQAFCGLIAAGRQPGPKWGSHNVECCRECPHHMHCSLEYSTYAQYQACQRRKLP